jgi:Uma2 family endonuclease
VNTAPPSESRLTAERYLALVEQGVLGPDDRVELIEGVIVAMAPHSMAHAAGVRRATRALIRAVGERAAVQVQLSLHVNDYSVPEPDLAVLEGTEADYDHRRPTTALLVVEVAASSLPQDRITKARLYAATGIPEYWIVNLRDDCVEVHRAPVPEDLRYAMRRLARRGETIGLERLPGAMVEVDALLPTPPVDGDSVEG